ncbi:hypothetical protein LO772_18685 [Yinghuangia sp. ASG 101]|uniref:DUF2201 family putative metallopeptidase n=1 Tax=Yinghuangia sp. ASG 101 TaxID=2896848 RepID=UPI001E2D2F02|nr:hypothetical protein [Yinghuangia sp. ASG 101]UGQ09001.1 hypothetical protein LO772_18685 [Yinghuangia sp. ASG 101]
MAYGQTTSPKPLVVQLTDRRALEAWQPADEAVVAQARKLKEDALLDFGMQASVIASWLYTKCHHQIPTTAVDTAAVMASGDGTCLLLYNPDFFVSLGLDGVKFVLFHEARHLIQRHLFADPELRADPVFTLAGEVTINHVAMRRLGRTELPTIRRTDPETGEEVDEPTGVDPRKVHRQYVDDLTAQGLVPLPYDEFVETDALVYAELKRMKDPPVPPPLCVHLVLGDGTGEDDGLDPETVARISSEVLRGVLLSARRGMRLAREELLELLKRTDGATDNVSKLWGDLGAGFLRGETQKTRRVDWWQQWLIDVLASKLRDGERLVYPKKRGALLATLGHDPMLARRGQERTKVVVVAYDTSGSMPGHVVDWLTELVGHTDGVEAHWLSFDGALMPFKPGERVYGGGGTDFQQVADYVEGRLSVDGRRFEETADAVLMLTDGYAPHITPAEPDKWIWLITEGGDEWPESHNPPMACHRVTTGDH